MAWLEVLAASGLSGEHYVLNKMDQQCKRWLPRPAKVNDLEVAVCLLLQLPPCSKPAEEAGSTSVHGLRSYGNSAPKPT